MNIFSTDATFNKNWEIIYIGKKDVSPKEIMEIMIKNSNHPFSTISEFNPSKFDGAENVNSSHNLFYQHGDKCIPYVWEVYDGYALDIYNREIPGAYMIRRIGFWFQV